MTQTGPSHSVPKHSPSQALLAHLRGHLSVDPSTGLLLYQPPKALTLLEPLDISVSFVPAPGHTHEAAAQ